MKESPRQNHTTVSRRHNVAWILAVFVCFTVYSVFFSNQITITPSENQMTITFPTKENMTETILFSDITAVTITEVNDFGTLVSGGEDSNYRWGTWKNSQWETYTLCISTKHSNCIVLTASEHIYVFNFPKQEDTNAFYVALKDHLVKNGYSNISFYQ